MKGMPKVAHLLCGVSCIAACGSAGEQQTLAPSPAHVMASVSDVGDFPNAAGGVTLGSDSTGLSVLWRYSADRGIPGERPFFVTIGLSTEGCARLIRGEQVAGDGAQLGFPISGGGEDADASRPVQSVRFSGSPELRTFDMSLELGPVSRPGFAAAATGRIWGTLVVDCSLVDADSGRVIDDPDFSTDSCRDAVRQAGLTDYVLR